METENILGYQVTTKKREQCVNELYSWIEAGKKNKYFVCLNPHSLVVAENDSLFKQSITHSDIIVPDGTGMILASRILGGSIRSRVTGSGIFRELSRKINDSGKQYSYFFLGAWEENLKIIISKLKEEYPNIHIAGALSPPFRDEFSEAEIREMVESINNAKPDVLWIGLSAPKQEKWIFSHKDKIDVKLLCPIGAVFDFYSGKVRRPNQWFLNHGLEWLPRLLQQPKRLWKRMGISAPIFLFKVFKQKLVNFFSY